MCVTLAEVIVSSFCAIHRLKGCEPRSSRSVILTSCVLKVGLARGTGTVYVIECRLYWHDRKEMMLKDGARYTTINTRKIHEGGSSYRPSARDTLTQSHDRYWCTRCSTCAYRQRIAQGHLARSALTRTATAAAAAAQPRARWPRPLLLLHLRLLLLEPLLLLPTAQPLGQLQPWLGALLRPLQLRRHARRPPDTPSARRIDAVRPQAPAKGAETGRSMQIRVVK